MDSQSSQVAKVLKQSLAAWEENTYVRWEEKLSLCEALARAALEQLTTSWIPGLKSMLINWKGFRKVLQEWFEVWKGLENAKSSV